MLIECKYYDMSLARTKQIEKKIDAEQAALTEVEKLQRQKEAKEDLKEIIRRGEEHERKHKKVTDAGKVGKFVELYKAALLMAKTADMNITVLEKDDDTYGYIELAYNQCWFIQDMPKSCFMTMAALYETAHSIYTETKDGKVLQKFDFILADEVEVK